MGRPPLGDQPMSSTERSRRRRERLRQGATEGATKPGPDPATKGATEQASGGATEHATKPGAAAATEPATEPDLEARIRAAAWALAKARRAGLATYLPAEASRIAEVFRPRPDDDDVRRRQRAAAALAWAKVDPLLPVDPPQADAAFASAVADRVAVILKAADSRHDRSKPGLITAADAKLILLLLHPDHGGDVALFRAFEAMRPKLDQGAIAEASAQAARREAEAEAARKQEREAAKVRRAAKASRPPSA